MASEINPMPAAEHLPAQLAELVLNVSRRLTLLDHDDSDTVPLGAVEAMVMRYIDAHPGVAPSQISTRLGLKSSNTSTALRDLEAKGFIRRGFDPADGRGVRVDPTPLARQNLARKRARWDRQLSPHLPDKASLAAAIELLFDLDAALEDSPSLDGSKEPHTDENRRTPHTVYRTPHTVYRTDPRNRANPGSRSVEDP